MRLSLDDKIKKERESSRREEKRGEERRGEEDGAGGRESTTL